MFERLLEDFRLTSAGPDVLVLTNAEGYVYELSLVNPTTLRQTLVGPDRPLPPQDNIISSSSRIVLPGLSIDQEAQTASFTLPDGKNVILQWKVNNLNLAIYETFLSEIDEPRLVFSTLKHRGFLLSEHGIVRYDVLIPDSIRTGLGEKGAPLDLTTRSFSLTGTDAAAYDAYNSDPLYKHTPWLMTLPKPVSGSPAILPSAVASYHSTNSDGRWDVHQSLCDPYGVFTSYRQDWGGLDEYILFGDGVNAQTGAGARELVQGFAQLVGSPQLVPRDWLGYLASGMGLGESDSPPAQELLEAWPALCKKHGIPCSAMHFSSGYTVGEDGNRYVFNMNTKRYPDFASMVKTFHRSGIKVTPNIKPFILASHPAYNGLKAANALFFDPFKKSSVTTQIWSSGVGENDTGAWVDMTHPAGRDWWCKGVSSLVELGCDSMWNDNNEYLLHNDLYQAANQIHRPIATGAPESGKLNVGLMGRMVHTQLMGEMSYSTMLKHNPDRRAFVVTRSANVGTMRFASSTWSGDNYTCWKTLQGSVAMGLNAGMSLLQSYGTDVGGFAGPLPTPELMVRWVQYGVTNSRFCIHSFKPTKDAKDGVAQTNTPWMYPEVLPIIRKEIKRRYALLPYLNTLNWESHLSADPSNSWLGYGPFANDAKVWTEEILNGFDYWMGTGRLLVAGVYHQGQTSRNVYFPRSHTEDQTVYFRLSSQHPETFTAGQTGTVPTPLDEFAIFARAGTVLPIGKSIATVTSLKGSPRTHIDGVDSVLVSEGGVVELDDWRAIEIFPDAEGVVSKGSWIEDDGVSLNPAKTVVKVTYSKAENSVSVKAEFVEKGFVTAWGKDLWVILPHGEEGRGMQVIDALDIKEHDGRKAYKIEVK